MMCGNHFKIIFAILGGWTALLKEKALKRYRNCLFQKLPVRFGIKKGSSYPSFIPSRLYFFTNFSIFNFSPKVEALLAHIGYPDFILDNESLDAKYKDVSLLYLFIIFTINCLFCCSYCCYCCCCILNCLLQPCILDLPSILIFLGCFAGCYS